MQFQVPQFIEVEDKIVGPLTIKQFVYLAGGAGAVVILYELLPIYIAILFGVPIAVFAAALAFYKVNNRPFIYTLEAAFNYALSHKLYLWKHEVKPAAPTQAAAPTAAPLPVPKLSQNRLKDIAWSLDIQESLYSKPDQRQ